jgi:hypothetical protein
MESAWSQTDRGQGLVRGGSSHAAPGPRLSDPTASGRRPPFLALGPVPVARINIAMIAKNSQFPTTPEDKNMEVGIETTNTRPPVAKKKRTRKERTLLRARR